MGWKRCESRTKKGTRCKNGAMKGQSRCGPHLGLDKQNSGTYTVRKATFEELYPGF